MKIESEENPIKEYETISEKIHKFVKSKNNKRKNQKKTYQQTNNNVIKKPNIEIGQIQNFEKIIRTMNDFGMSVKEAEEAFYKASIK